MQPVADADTSTAHCNYYRVEWKSSILNEALMGGGSCSFCTPICTWQIREKATTWWFWHESANKSRTLLEKRGRVTPRKGICPRDTCFGEAKIRKDLNELLLLPISNTHIYKGEMKTIQEQIGPQDKLDDFILQVLWRGLMFLETKMLQVWNVANLFIAITALITERFNLSSPGTFRLMYHL